MTSKRGLSRSELRTWRRYTSATWALFAALDRDLRSQAGISLDDLAPLRPLWAEKNGSLRMGELAERLSFSQSRMSHAVQRMEERGWVVREPSPTDARAKMVRLTDHGRAVFAEVWPDHAQKIRELFLEQLSPDERKVLEAAFARIARAAREDG